MVSTSWETTLGQHQLGDHLVLGDRLGHRAGAGQVRAERLLQQQRLARPGRAHGETGLHGGRHGEVHRLAGVARSSSKDAATGAP
ncbi:hypothetical protein GCM10009601_30260 [Streptomyces thermospinosisporus]|uniref:Uncharacterized protein n=1 Tax=Streptomyces thermospinosisporus TaxID=161482 RepID=A0ABN1YXF8_9ACTN